LAELITFALAYGAYVLLALAVALRAWGRSPRVVTASAAAVAAVHVALVWGLRFDWSVDDALRKSPFGFVLFHTALAILLAAAVIREPLSGWLALLAFPVVTAGAVGAAFRYDYVAAYRLPLLGAFVAAVVAVLWGWRVRRQREGPGRSGRPGPHE
jgi:hypothetical protein